VYATSLRRHSTFISLTNIDTRIFCPSLRILQTSVLKEVKKNFPFNFYPGFFFAHPPPPPAPNVFKTYFLMTDSADIAAAPSSQHFPFTPQSTVPARLLEISTECTVICKVNNRTNRCNNN
jgi:hypothetical protein